MAIASDDIAVEETQMPATDVHVEDARVERTEGASTSAPAPAVPAADETPNASEVDLPSFRPRKRGRAAFAVLVGSAAVAVAAGVGWSRIASHREQPAARAPAKVPERAPEPAPVAPSPAPAPTPVAPVEAASAPAPLAEGAVGQSPEKTPAAVTVTVKAVPEEAVIFRAGKRLGTGVVELSVEPNKKQRLTALLDGYTPSNIVVDGSSQSVTIVLKRAPKPRAATAAPSDSPSADAPSTDSTAASAPAPAPAPTAPSTEGTAQPAAQPDVSSATPSGY